jgi:PD-(D/E)XK nuclease superfamily
MLDPAFKFSQHSLGDYSECPRRFYLHYVAHQPWPMVESNPLGISPLEYQRYLWRGTVLHRWIERYWLGVPTQVFDDLELSVWWDRFQHTRFDDLPAQRAPELALVAPIGAYLLYARFDLLAIDPSDDSSLASQAVIVDWKTWRTDRRPHYQVFTQRLQTRIYLYVLATASAAYNAGTPFAPEQCSMRYWLANFPDHPWVDVPYSAADYAQDQTQLLALIEAAAHGETEKDYPRTEDERHCTHCTYLTLCNRKGAPSDADDVYFDSDTAAEIDY